MADEADFSTSGQPSLQQLATFFADEIFDVQRLRRVENALRNAHAEGATVAHAAQVQARPSMAEALHDGYETVKGTMERAIGAGLGALVGEILGIEVSPTELFHARRNPEDSAVGAAVAEVAFKAIRGPDGDLVPGDAAAKRLLGMLSHIIVHCWAEGIILEKVEHFFSTDGHIEAIPKLAKDLVDTLGLSRAARVAIRPLVRTVISTPMEWQVNKRYRPNLLSEALIAREFYRGTYTRAEADEEFARLGYSPKRIDALLAAQFKHLSLEDLLQLMRQGSFDRAGVLSTLRELGYDESTAQYALAAAEAKRLLSIEDNSLGALTRAFVNRDLTESEFQTLLPPNIYTDAERDTFVSAARIERGINVKHLSHAEVVDCIELEILPRAYYRGWLAREGYPDEEAFALELRLAARIDKHTDIERHRTDLELERAKEKADRLVAAEKRRLEVEAQRALHRRGSLADLNRAVVRGLISIARLEEVLGAEYDADTVAILVGLVEGDRQTYLEQLKRADEARQRAGVRNIDTGALEQAVLTNVLTIQEFSASLGRLGFPAGDAAILTATLQARKADLDAARAKRAAADEAAKRKSIDLGRAERLVRRGAGTFAQYDQLLASLGFDLPSRAAMAELLRLEMIDDAAAQKLRDAAAERARTKGLSLEQMRRAVLIGAKTFDQFQTYLVAEGYTSDAQLVLLAELRRDVADADAARAKRAAADQQRSAMPLPLTRVHQAARLGLITPATYRARLVAEHFTPDDIAIDLELLLVEIADVQAARAKRDEQAAAATKLRDLSLAQLEHAVRVGAASIDAYRAEVAALYPPDDAAVLVATLEAELATLEDARARRVTIDGELTVRTLSLGELEAAVKAGLVTLAAYRAQLVAWGYGSDDADLLASLLLEHLAAGSAAP